LAVHQVFLQLFGSALQAIESFWNILFRREEQFWRMGDECLKVSHFTNSFNQSSCGEKVKNSRPIFT